MLICTCLNSECRRTDSGFTLIEILVVMLIVSIMMGIAAVKLPGNSSAMELKQESERLVALFTMASDEAVISGRELGFNIKKERYTFYEFRDATENWVSLEEAPYQARSVAPGVELLLKPEGSTTLRQSKKKTPSILFLSSGEVTPFELTVFRANESGSGYIISTDGFSGFETRDRGQ